MRPDGAMPVVGVVEEGKRRADVVEADVEHFDVVPVKREVQERMVPWGRRWVQQRAWEAQKWPEERGERVGADRRCALQLQ